VAHSYSRAPFLACRSSVLGYALQFISGWDQLKSHFPATFEIYCRKFDSPVSQESKRFAMLRKS